MGQRGGGKRKTKVCESQSNPSPGLSPIRILARKRALSREIFPDRCMHLLPKLKGKRKTIVPRMYISNIRIFFCHSFVQCPGKHAHESRFCFDIFLLLLSQIGGESLVGLDSMSSMSLALLACTESCPADAVSTFSALSRCLRQSASIPRTNSSSATFSRYTPSWYQGCVEYLVQRG